MKLEAKQKLASIVEQACQEAGGQRALARKLGVSVTAVQGWLEQRSDPNPKNLALIAANAGFTLEEFFAYLELSNEAAATTSAQVVKQMRLLSREELLKVMEAGLKILATEPSTYQVQ